MKYSHCMCKMAILIWEFSQKMSFSQLEKKNNERKVNSEKGNGIRGKQQQQQTSNQETFLLHVPPR